MGGQTCASWRGRALGRQAAGRQAWCTRDLAPTARSITAARQELAGREYPLGCCSQAECCKHRPLTVQLMGGQQCMYACRRRRPARAAFVGAPSPAWKHSQYFFRQPLFLQLHPLLWRAPPELRLSACRKGGARLGGAGCRVDGTRACVQTGLGCDHGAARAAQRGRDVRSPMRAGCGGGTRRRCNHSGCLPALAAAATGAWRDGSLARHAAPTHPAGYLGSKGIGVALQYRLHCRLPGALMLPVVVAVEAVAAVAVAPRGEALAVAESVCVCMLGGGGVGG